MQTLYAINRARVQKRYFGWKWERETRIELELSLRNWMQRLPEHLKWNPAVQDDFALSQSAVLHTAFHHARVIVHNPFPFIQSAEQEGPPLEATAYGCSLAMSMSACTRAAHACSRVFAEQLDRALASSLHR
ncbi:hypothetical protein BKA62DRAFT_109836 [Auriculariales sp. MPI-PUGE-AT-0066]|nr:hypothetical protein BKA62DRAFT_109836 [Auriculariales sp. MPI-PUGE-AT-0066]